MYINGTAVLQLDQPYQVILGGNDKVEKEKKKKKRTPEMQMCLRVTGWWGVLSGVGKRTQKV